MPVAALLPRFSAPSAEPTPITPAAGSAQLQQLYDAFRAACTGTATVPVDDAACLAAYRAWQELDSRLRNEAAALAGRGLPAWLTRRPCPPGQRWDPGLGRCVLSTTVVAPRALPGPQPPRPPRPGRRWRAPRRPRQPRRPRSIRTRRAPRAPRPPRPPRVRPGRPPRPDWGYHQYCMSSKAGGWVCTGSVCVGHHEDVVARLATDIPWLVYTLTESCEDCGGSGCGQAGPGTISCQKIEWWKWWVKPTQRDEAREVGRRAERRIRRRAPRGFRRVRPPTPGAPDVLIPRDYSGPVEARNCWCLPEPWFLFPPGRMRCFNPPFTPKDVGLGDMWLFNPQGNPCPGD